MTISHWMVVSTSISVLFKPSSFVPRTHTDTHIHSYIDTLLVHACTHKYSHPLNRSSNFTCCDEATLEPHNKMSVSLSKFLLLNIHVPSRIWCALNTFRKCSRHSTVRRKRFACLHALRLGAIQFLYILIN